MESLQLDILRILNDNYKSKTEKVSRKIYDVIKDDFDGGIKAYIGRMTKEQILTVAGQIKGKNATDNDNRIITLP